MMATAHARHTADGVKALFMAAAVHLLVLVLLTLNLRWTPPARSQAVNVIKAVVVTEAPAQKKPAPPTATAEDAVRRRQVEAKRRAEAIRRQKAAKRQAEIKRRKAKAAAERRRKAAAEARHRQAQKLLQEQLAAEEAERQGRRLAAAQQKASRYIALIGDKVSSRFRKPPSSPRDAFAVVRVRVTPGGRVLSVTVVRSSGDPLFDRAIEDAVFLAEPLPVPTEADVFELLREFNIDTEKL